MTLELKEDPSGKIGDDRRFAAAAFFGKKCNDHMVVLCKSASWQPLDDKEKDGVPIAALMDVDEFEDYLEIQDPEVKRSIEESRKEYLAGKDLATGARACHPQRHIPLQPRTATNH